MGVVEDAGAGVTKLRKGDRVLVPFTIFCVECFFFEEELYWACENTNPGRGAILNLVFQDELLKSAARPIFIAQGRERAAQERRPFAAAMGVADRVRSTCYLLPPP